MTTPSFSLNTPQSPVAADEAALLRKFYTPMAVVKAVPAITAEIADAINAAVASAHSDAPRVTFCVSTNVDDMAGDVMSDAALERMRLQCIGKTFFCNHSWSVPGDVVGVIEDAQIVTRDLPHPVTGVVSSVRCLDFTVRFATSSPAAMAIYNLIAIDGVQMGASVTVLVMASHPDKTSGTTIIDDVYFVECSAVGVPMNQQAWVQRALDLTQKELNAMGNTPTKDAPQSKSLWEQSKAEQAATSWETLYDYWYAFQDGVRDLITVVEAGQIDNAEQALKDLIAGFGGDLFTLINPALVSVADSTADTQEASLATLHSILQKAGAKHSSQTKSDIEGMHADAHAMAHKCFSLHGAMDCAACKALDDAGDMSAGDSADDDAERDSTSKGLANPITGATVAALEGTLISLGADKKALEQRVADKDTQIATLTKELAVANRIAETALTKMERFLDQPMS